MTEIEGPGLSLRSFDHRDIEVVYRACQDSEIQRWTTVPSPYEYRHAEYFVDTFCAQQWRDDAGAPFAILDEAGELVGSIGLMNLNRAQRRAEIGYWTAPWARRRGVATRALRALSEWATTHGLERIALYADVENAASRTIAERAGFAFEGIARGYALKNGVRHDQAQYSLVFETQA